MQKYVQVGFSYLFFSDMSTFFTSAKSKNIHIHIVQFDSHWVEPYSDFILKFTVRNVWKYSLWYGSGTGAELKTNCFCISSYLKRSIRIFFLKAAENVLKKDVSTKALILGFLLTIFLTSSWYFLVYTPFSARCLLWLDFFIFFIFCLHLMVSKLKPCAIYSQFAASIP